MKIFNELLDNRALWVAILAWSVAQFAKVAIDLIRNKKIDLNKFIGSGGMPSSHSAFVCAMSVSVGRQAGFDSVMFAVCAVLSFIVMYDAAGVRRAAGKQATVINMIMEVVEEQGLKLDKKLKELLGHSPFEVFVGALLGISLGMLL